MKIAKAVNLILISLLIVNSTQTVLGQHQHDQSKQADKDKDRWMWQMPSRVINEIGIAEGMIVADIGAGEGYFSIPLAKAIGRNGKVYACDIDMEAINVLKKKSIDNNLNNINLIHGNTLDPLLPAKECDIILMVNTIHYIDDFSKYMENALKGLKPEGKIVIVQWDAEKMNRVEMAGYEEKFSMATTLRKIYNSGMDVQRILTFLPVQNIYICTINKD